MDLKLNILSLAHQKASHATTRQTVIANNIANADTPGFKALDVLPFERVLQARNDGNGLRTTRPAHLQFEPSRPDQATQIMTRSNEGASLNGNAVSLEQEMSKAVEVKQDFDLAMTVYRKSLDILRASLGR